MRIILDLFKILYLCLFALLMKYFSITPGGFVWNLFNIKPRGEKRRVIYRDGKYRVERQALSGKWVATKMEIYDGKQFSDVDSEFDTIQEAELAMYHMPTILREMEIRKYNYADPSESPALPEIVHKPKDPEYIPRIVMVLAVLSVLISPWLSAFMFAVSVWYKGKWSLSFSGSPLRFGLWVLTYLGWTGVIMLIERLL